MNQKELNATKQKFNEKMSNFQGTAAEKFLRYKAYFEWLNKSINDESWDSEMTLAKILKEQCDILYNCAIFTERENLKLSNLTSKVNSRISGLTINFRKRWGGIPKNERDDSFKEEAVNIVKEIKNCSDFPTKVFCWKILIEIGYIDKNFGDNIVKVQREKERYERWKKKQPTRVSRLCSDGSVKSEIQGTLYWNKATGEHMTYDECVQNGFNVEDLYQAKFDPLHPDDYPKYSQSSYPMYFVSETNEKAYQKALQLLNERQKEYERRIDATDENNVHDYFINRLTDIQRFRQFAELSITE